MAANSTPAPATIADRVCGMLGEHLSYFDDGQTVARQVKPDDSLREDHGADSLDIVELVMALEEEFGIEITDADADGWQTAGDIIKTVEGKL